MKDFYLRLERYLAGLVEAGAEDDSIELLAELRRRKMTDREEKLRAKHRPRQRGRGGC